MKLYEILEPNYKEYPIAGKYVDGLQVLDDIPNVSSISASFTNYKILPKIREIPFSDFNGLYQTTTQLKNLASQISSSGKIKPLVVVIDNQGPYILEGGHRYAALQIVGKKSFPALIVIDLD